MSNKKPEDLAALLKEAADLVTQLCFADPDAKSMRRRLLAMCDAALASQPAPEGKPEMSAVREALDFFKGGLLVNADDAVWAHGCVLRDEVRRLHKLPDTEKKP